MELTSEQLTFLYKVTEEVLMRHNQSSDTSKEFIEYKTKVENLKKHLRADKLKLSDKQMILVVEVILDEVNNLSGIEKPSEKEVNYLSKVEDYRKLFDPEGKIEKQIKEQNIADQKEIDAYNSSGIFSKLSKKIKNFMKKD